MPLSLTDRVFDVAIIGGGILGMAAARDCAMRRLSVVVFEKNDFGSGTTASGGGILSGEPMRLSTDPEATRTACQEIGVLQKIAPSLLTRIPILYPFLKAHSKTELDRFQTLADLYDRYARSKGGLPHVRLSSKEMGLVDAGFSPDVWGAISLDEWVTDPIRITIANAKSAAAAGASLVKGAEVTRVEVQSGRLIGVRVSLSNGEKKLVRARTVINAAGPLAPGHSLKKSVEFRYVRRTFLQFDRRISDTSLACSLASRAEPVYLFSRGNCTWLGPSELKVATPDLDAIGPSAQEVEFLLGTVRPYFPSIDRHRIVSSTTGIHCRVADIANTEGRPQAVFDHSTDGVEGFFTIVGGGVTRARLLAQEVTDLVSKKLRHRERCRTHLESLPGCTSEIPWLEESRRVQRDPLLVTRLIRRYGHRAEGILDSISQNTEFAQTVCECEQITIAEVDYALREEWVESLADLQRRTGLGVNGCKGARCLKTAARYLGSRFDWDIERMEKEVGIPSFPETIAWGEEDKQREYSECLKSFGRSTIE
jgi:glycerol-3-phosphate dehydrogenase